MLILVYYLIIRQNSICAIYESKLACCNFDIQFLTNFICVVIKNCFTSINQQLLLVLDFEPRRTQYREHKTTPLKIMDNWCNCKHFWKTIQPRNHSDARMNATMMIFSFANLQDFKILSKTLQNNQYLILHNYLNLWAKIDLVLCILTII